MIADLLGRPTKEIKNQLLSQDNHGKLCLYGAGLAGKDLGLYFKQSGGVAFDIFNLKNSRIAYNTVIDCSGMFEIGNLDALDSTSGAQYDTVAFNKVIKDPNIINQGIKV